MSHRLNPSWTSLLALLAATMTAGGCVGLAEEVATHLVFLEALFDAHEGLPAVAPINEPELEVTGLMLPLHELPLYQPTTGHVDSADLTRMTHINNGAATKTRVILKRIIAGIGPFSLNNQPLEDFIVEIITTSVRKATEKATWCWYACNLDVEVEKLESDVKTAVDDKAEEVEQKVETEEQKIESRVKAEAGKVQTKAGEDVEQVKLRFKLSK